MNIYEIWKCNGVISVLDSKHEIEKDKDAILLAKVSAETILEALQKAEEILKINKM